MLSTRPASTCIHYGKHTGTSSRGYSGTSAAWLTAASSSWHRPQGLLRCQLGRLPRHVPFDIGVLCQPRWLPHLMVVQAPAHGVTFWCEDDSEQWLTRHPNAVGCAISSASSMSLSTRPWWSTTTMSQLFICPRILSIIARPSTSNWIGERSRILVRDSESRAGEESDVCMQERGVRGRGRAARRVGARWGMNDEVWSKQSGL